MNLIRPAAFTLLLALGASVAGWSPAASAQGRDPTALHDALHLTPVQEMAWKTYRGALTPDPAAQARQRAAQMLMPSLSTPRRIDLINAEMEADLAALRKQGDAVKTFYAQLTPDQQRVFDIQTLPKSQPSSGD